MNYDIADVPFSTFGSYMSVSALTGKRAPDDAAGLWVRSHHNGAHPLFRITATRDGSEAATKIDAAPTRLRLTSDGGAIDLCFDGSGTLRLRGSGLGVVLEPCKGAVIYATSDKLMTINVRAATRRYQIECLAGGLSLHGPWQAGVRKPVRLEVAPGADGNWEIAIDEFLSTWVPRDRPDFDTCATAVDQQFATFLSAMPPAPDHLAEARELATYIDWAATVNPEGLLRRPAMLMSKNWMCNVWSWDHCFNAMALTPGHMGLAWDQMLVVADHQDSFGCLPDSINDVDKQYNFSKPPIHGWTVGEMLRRAPAPPGDVLEALYDSLCRQATWWLTYRRYAGDSLPHYLHGNDSGWDNSTMFDRGVPLIAPDLAAFMVVSCDELAEIAARLNRQDEAARWRDQADRLLAALLDELWDGDRFIALATRARTPVVCESLVPCMPILLGKRLPQPVIEALVASLRRFLTEWGLATEHPSSQAYAENGYWRGPIWAPSTYLAVCGLERSGEYAMAREVAERFCRLCANSGFAENFDAVRGLPLCDRAYTWTASVFVLLAEKLCNTPAVS